MEARFRPERVPRGTARAPSRMQDRVRTPHRRGRSSSGCPLLLARTPALNRGARGLPHHRLRTRGLEVVFRVEQRHSSSRMRSRASLPCPTRPGQREWPRRGPHVRRLLPRNAGPVNVPSSRPASRGMERTRPPKLAAHGGGLGLGPASGDAVVQRNRCFRGPHRVPWGPPSWTPPTRQKDARDPRTSSPERRRAPIRATRPSSLVLPFPRTASPLQPSAPCHTVLCSTWNAPHTPMESVSGCPRSRHSPLQNQGRVWARRPWTDGPFHFPAAGRRRLGTKVHSTVPHPGSVRARVPCRRLAPAEAGRRGRKVHSVHGCGSWVLAWFLAPPASPRRVGGVAGRGLTQPDGLETRPVPRSSRHEGPCPCEARAERRFVPPHEHPERGPSRPSPRAESGNGAAWNDGSFRSHAATGWAPAS